MTHIVCNIVIVYVQQALSQQFKNVTGCYKVLVVRIILNC